MAIPSLCRLQETWMRLQSATSRLESGGSDRGSHDVGDGFRLDRFSRNDSRIEHLSESRTDGSLRTDRWLRTGRACRSWSRWHSSFAGVCARLLREGSSSQVCYAVPNHRWAPRRRFGLSHTPHWARINCRSPGGIEPNPKPGFAVRQVGLRDDGLLLGRPPQLCYRLRTRGIGSIRQDVKIAKEEHRWRRPLGLASA